MRAAAVRMEVRMVKRELNADKMVSARNAVSDNATMITRAAAKGEEIGNIAYLSDSYTHTCIGNSSYVGLRGYIPIFG